MCLREKILVLDKNCSGVSSNAICYNFNVNESAAGYVLKKQGEMC